MVNYFIVETKILFKNRRECTNWIKSVVIEEGNDSPKKVGDISVIFCSDEYLLNINKQYLSHDYYTDVITFDNSEGKILSGDIFISTDTVRSNSKIFKQEFSTELNRVIIHGVLHLLGYDDQTKRQTKVMRAKEDYYLSKRKSL
ncbi:MAG: rRNA maturation RNase YbeY [Bacteroidales bacterium]